MQRILSLLPALALTACVDIPEECHRHDRDFADRVPVPPPATPLQPGESRRVGVRADNPANRSGITVESGAAYRVVVVEGRACDQQYPSGADGIPSPNPVLLASERLRMVPDARWMELVAAENGSRVRVGNGPVDVEASGSGELLFFLNDVPDFHGNNHGAFFVEVTRTR